MVYLVLSQGSQKREWLSCGDIGAGATLSYLTPGAKWNPRVVSGSALRATFAMFVGSAAVAIAIRTSPLLGCCYQTCACAKTRHKCFRVSDVTSKALFFSARYVFAPCA